MSNYEKPLPAVTIEAEPFWQACKQHKLVIQRCKDCGNLQFHPRIFCANCWSHNIEWIETAGKGVIYDFTIVRRAPTAGFNPDVPFVIALIDLNEGVRMMSNIIKINPEDVKIGMPVRVEFDDVTEEITLPKFRPL